MTKKEEKFYLFSDPIVNYWENHWIREPSGRRRAFITLINFSALSLRIFAQTIHRLCHCLFRSARSRSGGGWRRGIERIIKSISTKFLQQNDSIFMIVLRPLKLPTASNMPQKKAQFFTLPHLASSQSISSKNSLDGNIDMKGRNVGDSCEWEFDRKKLHVTNRSTLDSPTPRIQERRKVRFIRLSVRGKL